VIGDDAADSVFAYLRADAAGNPVLIVLNMTPMVRQDFRVGVPRGGYWAERLNSDAAVYGGSNAGNSGGVAAEFVATHGHPWSLRLCLPPLAALVLQP
jgi:1,4-alpha-glucan branching enzyme